MYIYCVYIAICICIILCNVNVYAIHLGKPADSSEEEKSPKKRLAKLIKVGRKPKTKEETDVESKEETKREPKAEPGVVPDPGQQSKVKIDGALNPVELNISNNFSTVNYEYFGKKKHCTFKAMRGYGFSRIKSSGKSKDSVVIIWTAKDSSEYLTDVISTKYESNTEDLVMHLSDGTVKKLIRYYDQGWMPIDLEKLNSVTINIDSVYHSFAYFNCYYGDYAVFKAKAGFAFDGLVECDNDICSKVKNVWKARDEDHYLKEVTIDEPHPFRLINHVVIVLVNDRIKHLARAYRRWVEVQPSVELDVSVRKSNFYFNYSIDNEKKIVTFVPKAKFLFKGVNCTEGYLRSKNLVEIWRTKNPREYSRKVMVVPFTKKDIFIIILLINGKFKLFNKCDRFISWQDHTNHVFSQKSLKQIGIDLDALRSAKEQDIPEPTKPIERPELQLHPASSLESLSSRNYQPVLTKLLESSILSRARSHIPIPKPQGRNLIHLDITQRSDIIGYSISYKDNKVIFNAHPGFLFAFVMSGNEMLWEYKGLDYPNKVLYKKVDGKDKVKVYFPEDSKVGSDMLLDTPVAPPKPKVRFNPYDIQVDVVSFKKSDKKPEGGPFVTPTPEPLSHPQNGAGKNKPKPPQANN